MGVDGRGGEERVLDGDSRLHHKTLLFPGGDVVELYQQKETEMAKLHHSTSMIKITSQIAQSNNVQQKKQKTGCYIYSQIY